MTKKHQVIASLILLVLAISSCDSHTHKQLQNIIRVADTNADKADLLIHEIDSSNLSEKERALYSLIKIKIDDKHYIVHTTDSLILAIESYYNNHPNRDILPEVLYYSGRIYSDMGDVPTAISKYEDALNLLSETNRSSILRGNVLSQMSRLLINLHLFNEAIPHLKDLCRQEANEGDTLNLISDLMLLGYVHLRQDSIEQANKIYKQAKNLAITKNNESLSLIDVYLSTIERKKGNINSSIKLLNNGLSHLSNEDIQTVYAHAATTFLTAHMPDSAIKYAQLILNYPRNFQKASAYYILTSPEIAEHLPSDSIMSYLFHYRDVLNKQNKEHESIQAIMQHTRYNYQLHEKARQKAEVEKHRLISLIYISTTIFLLVCIFFTYLGYRYNKRIVRLHDSLERLRFIKDNSLNTESSDETNIQANTSLSAMSSTSLREQLTKELHSISNLNARYRVTDEILTSNIYNILRQKISLNTSISDNSELWSDIYRLINDQYPNFFYHLKLLSGDSLKKHELQTAALIKLGFTPNDFMILLSKAKGTISSRRIQLGEKILGMRLSTRDVDKIIQSL